MVDSYFNETEFSKKIKKANSISLEVLFNYYNIYWQSKKIKCPLPKHKGGKENTPSFQYYPDTNTYYCFGCKSGNKPCDFISSIENISKIEAANKILSLSGTSSIIYNEENNINFSERLELSLDLSNKIREFYKKHTDKKSILFIEEVCKTYDLMNEKYKNKLNNESFKSLIDKLKVKIDNFNI